MVDGFYESIFDKIYGVLDVFELTITSKIIDNCEEKVVVRYSYEGNGEWHWLNICNAGAFRGVCTIYDSFLKHITESKPVFVKTEHDKIAVRTIVFSSDSCTRVLDTSLFNIQSKLIISRRKEYEKGTISRVLRKFNRNDYLRYSMDKFEEELRESLRNYESDNELDSKLVLYLLWKGSVPVEFEHTVLKGKLEQLFDEL